MDDKIYIKCGALDGRAKMPSLNYNKELGSEIAYHTEEEALYIGTESGNKRLCGVNDIGNINTRLEMLNASVTSILTQIGDINSQISSINEQITNITARLNASETPSE